MIIYYARDGQPLDMHGWAALHGDPDYRRVAEDTVGGYWVSTVWLGIDHNFGVGPPLIFETMVFDDPDLPTEKTSMLEHDCRRYATEAAALQGHAEMVTLLRATEDA